MSPTILEAVTIIASLFSSILAVVIYRGVVVDLRRYEKERKRKAEQQQEEAERHRFYQELLIEFSKDGDTKVLKKISHTSQRKIS